MVTEATRQWVRDQYGYEREQAFAGGHTADTLRKALRDALNDVWSTGWTYVRDWDENQVIFSHEEDDGDSSTFREGYMLDTSGKVTLAGDRTKVDERVSWVPVTETAAIRERAFMLRHDGKTKIVAPALIQTAAVANPHMVPLRAALVGANKPNRNNALWTTADLEMGQPSVNFGPINWLHKESDVIGVLTDSQMVYPSQQAAETSMVEPYIAVAGVAWKWLASEHLAVMQMASAGGSLFISMECVSEQVACQADGCGREFPYVDFVRQSASVDFCDHVFDVSVVKRFVAPTFMGAGVIVPPATAGWEDGHLELMQAASEMAPSLYEASGSKMVASEFERLVAMALA